MGTVLVRMKTSMADHLGRAYQPKRIYQFDEEEAASLIDAGFCELATINFEEVCEQLKGLGAGLVISDKTEEALIDAAELSKIELHDVREATQTEVEPEPEPEPEPPPPQEQGLKPEPKKKAATRGRSRTKKS